MSKTAVENRQCVYVRSPLGWAEITANCQGITSLYFVEKPGNERPDTMVLEAKQQLSAYFSGELKNFDLPLNASGTHFQKQVWQALLDINYGTTQSYSQIAQYLNNPKAVRAVGAANGRNPISIIVPCHRVIGANGTLTGYAGGLRRKEWLLQLEQKHR